MIPDGIVLSGAGRETLPGPAHVNVVPVMVQAENATLGDATIRPDSAVTARNVALSDDEYLKHPDAVRFAILSTLFGDHD